MMDHTHQYPPKFTRIHGSEREEKSSLVQKFATIRAYFISLITVLDIVSDYFFIYVLFTDEEFKETNPYNRTAVLCLSILIVFLGQRLYFLIFVLHSLDMESSITLQSGVSMLIPGVFTYIASRSNERIHVQFKGARRDKFMDGTGRAKSMCIIPPPAWITEKIKTPKGWAFIVFLHYEVLYSLPSLIWLPIRMIWSLFFMKPRESRGERTFFSVLESIVESCPQTLVGLMYFASREGDIANANIFVRISIGLSIFSLLRNFIYYNFVRSKMHGILLRDHHAEQVPHIIPLPVNNRTYLSGSRDRSLRIWDLQRPVGRPSKLTTKKVINTTRLIRAMNYLHSNIVIIGNSGGIIEFWDIKFNRLIKELDSGLTDQLYTLASIFSKKDKDEDNRRYFYRIAAVGLSKKESESKRESESTGKVVFLECIVETRKKDKKVSIKINYKTSPLTLPCDRCYSCQWLISKRQLAILHGDQPKISIIEEHFLTTLKNNEENHVFKENDIKLQFITLCEHENFSTMGHRVKVFPNEKKIVSTHGDGVRLWDLADDSNPSSRLIWHHEIPTECFGLCVSEDCRYIAAGDEEGSVRIWYIDPHNPTNEHLMTRPALYAHGRIYSMCFSGTYEFKELLCSGDDSVIYVFAQNRDQSSV